MTVGLTRDINALVITRKPSSKELPELALATDIAAATASAALDEGEVFNEISRSTETITITSSTDPSWQVDVESVLQVVLQEATTGEIMTINFASQA